MLKNDINILLNYNNLTENDLNNVMKNYVNLHDKLVENLLNIENKELNWDNLVKPFIDLNNIYVENALLEMSDFHPNEQIRNVSIQVSTDFKKWMIEQNMRKDIYQKYDYYYNNQYQEEKNNLSQEQVSYLNNLMISYQIYGMNLSKDKFDRFREIKKEITELCAKFSQNLCNDNYIEYVNVSELTGLPDKFIEDRLENDKVKLTLKYPDYIPLMEYCENREIRKKFSKLFKSVCINENTPIIEKVFKLRSEIADLFEYKNYSDYKLQRSMAETTFNVNQFIINLLTKIKPLLNSDYESLINLANKDGITKLELYDIPYYSRIFIENTCNFDKDELKKWFPVNKVLSGAFEIYQKILGYKFEKVLGLEHLFWDKSVELYQVIDTNTGLSIGYFYLDLYPREGKYGHAACFPFINKSEKTLPVATMVCNFGKNNLTFEEVETFFHEFGHVMHHLSSKSTISSTSSFSCEHDFVETPSQMFEEWCYSKETLLMMSDNLPIEMVDKLNQSRKLLQGYHYSRQLMFATFDMTIHSNKYLKLGLTPIELFNKIQKEILKMDTLEGTNEVARFGHLMGGYDAGYYGYAWSLVYAKDLFSKFKSNGLLNTELGIKLREQVLSQGSIRKSMESITEFLGREPTNEEFIKSIC
jgi:thimet oligopeptidase